MDNKMAAIFDGLNDEQKQAVACVEGPVLIVAGAGSGKTRVLTSRVANILAHDVPPESILALTFTKKAASEMKERIAMMVGYKLARRVVMGTFHAVFVRFLREYASSLGYTDQFTIYDQSDSTSAVKVCVKELGLDDKVYKPRDVLSRISMAKNNLCTVAAYRNNRDLLMSDLHAKRPKLVDVYDLYQQKLKQSNVMDFDDILVNMNILLRDNREALASIAGRFSYIMVDEYQDTNYSQYLILKKLSAAHRNLCVVGDDSQSIYAFRGAKIENILNFKRDYPESRIFRLERNYRSTSTIVDAANSVIAHNEGRIKKTCYSLGEEGEKINLINEVNENDEAMAIVSDIIMRLRTDSAKYQDFAILYRTNSQSRVLEEKLRIRNIPYVVYSGNSFFERAEVKDLMAYFKLCVNTNDDESFKRIVNLPARGIGATSISALNECARAHGCSLFKAAWMPDYEQFGLRPAAAEKIRAFCKMIDGFAAAVPTTDAFDLARSIADKSGIYAMYKADTSIEGQARLSNVDELINSVEAYIEDQTENFEEADGSNPGETVAARGFVNGRGPLPEAVGGMERSGSFDGLAGIGPGSMVVTLGDYLENVTLLSNVDATDDEDAANRVALMTVHSSKGLEFPYVYIAGLEENLFPSVNSMTNPQEVEEERRLFYVAITRAKKAVSLSYADTRMRNGNHESNRPSRFISEIDSKYLVHPLVDTFEPTVERRPAWGGFGSRTGAQHGGYGQSGRVTIERRRPDQERPAMQSRPVSAGPSRPVGAKPAVIDPDFVPVPMTELYVGERVEHNRFGGGLIKSISGTFPEMKAVIVFDDYGEKLLLLKFAKLRPEKK